MVNVNSSGSYGRLNIPLKISNLNRNQWETSERDAQSFAKTLSRTDALSKWLPGHLLHASLSSFASDDAETQITKSPSSSPMAMTSTQSMSPSRRFSWSSKRSSSSTVEHPEMMDSVDVFLTKRISKDVVFKGGEDYLSSGKGELCTVWMSLRNQCQCRHYARNMPVSHSSFDKLGKLTASFVK